MLWDREFGIENLGKKLRNGNCGRIDRKEEEDRAGGRERERRSRSLEKLYLSFINSDV